MKIPYKWNLVDGYPAAGIELHQHKVFGTFICGGGSTMGYKLAGWHHLGGVEIDPPLADIYRLNHNPGLLYVEDIREFTRRQDLPAELFDLDLLDGSPPCSSFSMAGNREADWGKEKIFREGQVLQTLDDLFFDFIDLVKKLQPKVALAENVKGLILGNAKPYVKRIKAAFEAAGYLVQLFMLNAASMGVPQRRERVFFIARRKDLNYPDLKLSFAEPAITLNRIIDLSNKENDLTQVQYDLWLKQKPGDKTLADVRHALNGFTDYLLHNNDVCMTLCSGGKFMCKQVPRHFTTAEYCQVGSFPLDYNFGSVDPKFLIGMSVPPVMIAQVALRIFLQWFNYPVSG